MTSPLSRRRSTHAAAVTSRGAAVGAAPGARESTAQKGRHAALALGDDRRLIEPDDHRRLARTALRDARGAGRRTSPVRILLIGGTEADVAPLTPATLAAGDTALSTNPHETHRGKGREVLPF